MTIARRIVFSIVALGAGLLVAGAGIVFAFSMLQRLTKSTHEEFHELCDLRLVALHTTKAQRHLTRGERNSVQAELQEALAQLASFDWYQEAAASEFDAQHAHRESEAARRILNSISDAHHGLSESDPGQLHDANVRAALERAEDELSALIAQTEQAIADVNTRTAGQFVGTLWFVVLSVFTSFIAAVAIGVLLYRSVVAPLRRMRAGTDRLSEGKLGTRLDVSGDLEFVELQHAFNRMAAELESTCQNLERRVAQKSQELAVSERLASVGFLAAGVAHEINNPLAIMSGYAESILRTAKNGGASNAAAAWIRDLETIRDEAFRCKKITQCLLDLSRLGDNHRERVPVNRVVDTCTRLISAWPASRDVRFEVRPAVEPGSMVLASEPELRQVILNLLANAVEAAAPTHGTVTITTGQHNGWVEMKVQDNGCGMSSEILAHAFEPFFSSGKPGSGLGLGLAISHAIARRHGGVLEAISDGAGQGSTLVLRLPALSEQPS